jgi:hypothetical protein
MSPANRSPFVAACFLSDSRRIGYISSRSGRSQRQSGCILTNQTLIPESREKSMAPCVETDCSPTISQITLREVADGDS